MSLPLPTLPYELNALEPFISKETLEYHFGKHHIGYANRLNTLLSSNKTSTSSTPSLIELVKTSQGAIFNCAAQVYNHDFYWRSMRPNGGGEPSGQIATAIQRDFGSFANFKRIFNEVAMAHFGSGWAWLVQDPKTYKLQIVSTHDAENPIRGILLYFIFCIYFILFYNQYRILENLGVPLLTCDVWEVYNLSSS